MKRQILVLGITTTLAAYLPSPVDDARAHKYLARMTRDQKIGQLFMPGVPISAQAKEIKYAEKLVSTYHVGGVLILGSGKNRHACTKKRMSEIVNRLRKKADMPLLLSIDAEWGLAMRLVDARSFARAEELGVMNSHQVYRIAKKIGRECRHAGFHINFAPVADVNTNPDNPVIGNRAFGNTPELVIEKAAAYMNGLHDAGVLSCIKHFPGHGDTHLDSHEEMPVVTHNRARLDAVELVPFAQLITAGAPMVMVGHLHVPALDATPGLPASLSHAITTDLLQHEFGFDGLVITDGLKMHGIAHQFDIAQMALGAFAAGHDIILDLHKTHLGIEAIKQAVDEGLISMQEIDRRVLKILKAKLWCGVIS